MKNIIENRKIASKIIKFKNSSFYAKGYVDFNITNSVIHTVNLTLSYIQQRKIRRNKMMSKDLFFWRNWCWRFSFQDSNMVKFELLQISFNLIDVTQSLFEVTFIKYLMVWIDSRIDSFNFFNISRGRSSPWTVFSGVPSEPLLPV